MTRHTLRIPWAGPAVLAALLLSPPAPRPAHAAPAPVASVATAQTGMCIQDAVAIVGAVDGWLHAWENYTNSLPGGTPDEIRRAVDRLNTATQKVIGTGMSFILCLMKHLE